MPPRASCWRRKAATHALQLLFFGLLACGGDGGTTPDPVDPNSIEAQIIALFPAGAALRDAALSRIGNVRAELSQNNTSTAKTSALSLVDLTLVSLSEGRLIGGKTESTRTSASKLVDDIYQLVSLSAPHIPDAALTDDGAAKVVGPSGGVVVTSTGAAGVGFPPGALPEDVLVTIVKIPAPSTPGTGPLPTALKQYPPFYEYSTTPAVAQFGSDARVGICQVTDPSSPLYPPEPHDRLRLAHRVGTGPDATTEILELADVSDFLKCSGVKPIIEVAPGQAAITMAHGGLGGKTKKFSPFGAVDPSSGPVASVTVLPSRVTEYVGDTVRLLATLNDASGAVLTGRSVTWSSSNQLASVDPATGLVTALAPGSATITAQSEGKQGTATVNVTSFSTLSVGSFHSCAVPTTGLPSCWGSNATGDLGDGTRTDRRTPVAVQGGLVFKSISAGLNTTCAVTVPGTGYCWGENVDAKIGDGTTTGDRLTPTLVQGGISFSRIVVGDSHTCGLNTGGALYCWGLNTYGQLGDGTTTKQLTPTLAQGARAYSALALGQYHTCGLSSGAAFCTGRNANGQLGDGTVTESHVVVPVQGGLNFTSITAGQSYTCGLATSGAAYCWGFNPDGLGDGTTNPRFTPTAVQGGLVFTMLEAGGDHTCGLTSAGAAYCWGRNANGGLGDGTTTQRLTPVPVLGGLVFRSISVKRGYTCGLTVPGAAYCWGANNTGQLGDGTLIDRLTPTRVVPP